MIPLQFIDDEADDEILPALEAGLTVGELDFYAGVICEACRDGDACVTDLDGLHLCAVCAACCILPEYDA